MPEADPNPAAQEGEGSTPTDPPSQVQGEEGKRDTRFDSERARAAARKRWDKPRDAEAGTGSGAADRPQTGGAEPGSGGLTERLWAILRNPKARDGDVISAARTLADLDRGTATALPTSARQVQEASLDQLYQWLHQLGDPALPLPGGVEPEA